MLAPNPAALLLAIALNAAAEPAGDRTAPAAATPAAADQAPRCTLWLEIGGVGSTTEDLARVAELTGAAPVRSQLVRQWSSTPSVLLCEGGPAPHPAASPAPPPPAGLELRALPLGWRSYLQTGYPDDRNDGALWRGEGLSTELTGGLRLRWGPLSAAAAPVIAWQQNGDFHAPPYVRDGYSPYANPFNGGAIDLPLRFGPDPFWTVDPGQSYVRLDLWNVALGLSTENMWWGPGTQNSLLMTNSGPGMLHAFLGTSRPQDVYLGWLEAQLTWGWPRESEWFKTKKESDRLFTAANLVYEPRWVPGLFLGFTRVFMYRVPPGGLPWTKYVGPLFQSFFKSDLASADNPSGSDPDNQLFSLSARWVFPASGLEIYGEWGRDDHSWDVRDLVTEPEHAQAYMLGLQKVFPTGAGWLRLVAELTDTLQKPTNNPPRAVPIFYTHGMEIQGYTHDGQALGAGIGPQANSQFLAVDLFHAAGRTGVWFERVLRNGRYFYDQVHTFAGEDAEISAGVRGLWSTPALDVEYALGVGHRYDMNFGPDVSSWKGTLSVTWWPGRAQAPALPAPLPPAGHAAPPAGDQAAAPSPAAPGSGEPADRQK